jgi:DNA-binding NarL/FixJ family response regulator
VDTSVLGNSRADLPADRRRGLIVVSQVRFVRESLGEILDREVGWTTLELCADLDAAQRACRALQPDAVLLDAAFPDGAHAVGDLRAVAPRSRVVAFAVTETEDDVIAWAEAGIAGYVPNTAGLADLAMMLTTIMGGAQLCSPRIAAGLFRWIGERGALAAAPAAKPRSVPALTAREQQIIAMIGTGMSNKDIARRLNIGVATAKTHVHNLLVKLNMQRRGQAAAWMHEHAEPPPAARI